MVKLAKKFPQLQLADSKSLDLSQAGVTDFFLSPQDLTPLISTYRAYEPLFNPHHAAEKIEKAYAGSFWWKVGQMKTLDDKEHFPLLFKLMAGVLSIPSSNADSERVFSVLRKIHTDQRSKLDYTTIVSLMPFKFNCDTCCYDTILTGELLVKYKRATYKSLHQ